jgi:hypothetical protein
MHKKFEFFDDKDLFFVKKNKKLFDFKKIRKF